MANIEFWGSDVPLEFPGQSTPGTDWVPPAAMSKWDLFYIAGQVLPGVAHVRGKRSHRVDKKYSPGQDGATLTHLGNNLAEIDLKLVIWLKWQWETLQRMMSTIFPVNNKAPHTPFDCSHPSLTFHRIKSLYLLNVSFPIPEKDADIYAIDFAWSEFSPAKKKGTANTPTQSLDLSGVKVSVQTVPIGSDQTANPSQTNSDASVAPPIRPSP